MQARQSLGTMTTRQKACGRATTRVVGFDQRRARGTQRYKKWRTRFMRANPLCAACRKKGLTVAAREMDHRDPCGADPKKFWDGGNVQALCRPCHQEKTLAENARARSPESEAWAARLGAEY